MLKKLVTYNKLKMQMKESVGMGQRDGRQQMTRKTGKIGYIICSLANTGSAYRSQLQIRVILQSLRLLQLRSMLQSLKASWSGSYGPNASHGFSASHSQVCRFFAIKTPTIVSNISFRSQLQPRMFETCKVAEVQNLQTYQQCTLMSRIYKCMNNAQCLR